MTDEALVRSIKITPDFNSLQRIGARDFSNTRKALMTAAQNIQKKWVEYASGSPVNYSGGTFVVRRVTGNYVRSVMNGLRLNADGNPFAVAVVADTPYAKAIETGSKAHDMTYLLYGDRAKISKAGKRYVTIAFSTKAGSIGGGSRSGGVVFRRMSEDNVWHKKAVPPRPVSKAVKEAIEPEVMDIIRQGMILDIGGGK